MSLSRGCWCRSKPLITQRHLTPPSSLWLSSSVARYKSWVNKLQEYCLRFRDPVNLLKELKTPAEQLVWKILLLSASASTRTILNKIEQQQQQQQPQRQRQRQRQRQQQQQQQTNNKQQTTNNKQEQTTNNKQQTRTNNNKQEQTTTNKQQTERTQNTVNYNQKKKKKKTLYISFFQPRIPSHFNLNDIPFLVMAI